MAESDTLDPERASYAAAMIAEQRKGISVSSLTWRKKFERKKVRATLAVTTILFLLPASFPGRYVPAAQAKQASQIDKSGEAVSSNVWIE